MEVQKKGSPERDPSVAQEIHTLLSDMNPKEKNSTITPLDPAIILAYPTKKILFSFSGEDPTQAFFHLLDGLNASV